jgi:NADH-quinone oxidoreductase subunit J
MEAAVFYIIAAVVALSALGCVLCTNIVRMATCLFGTLGAVAVLYFMLDATFLGVIQLIVYAGGTLIVIIFGVMLTTQAPRAKFTPSRIEIVAGASVCMILFACIAGLLINTNWMADQPDAVDYSAKEIGNALLTTYLVPFEIVSVLLLAVMIGAAFLARPERK